MSEERVAVINGTIPSGERFASSMSHGIIALRVNGRTCAAHPNWMDDDQTRRLIRHLQDTLDT